MNWNLLVTGPAQKHLRKLPVRDRDRVKNRFLTFAALTRIQSRDREGAVGRA